MKFVYVFVIGWAFGFLASVAWLYFNMRSNTDPSWIDSFWFGTVLLCPFTATYIAFLVALIYGVVVSIDRLFQIQNR